MLKREWGVEKQWKATASIQSLVKLQAWFLSFRWKTYPWAEHSDDDDDDDGDITISKFKKTQFLKR